MVSNLSSWRLDKEDVWTIGGGNWNIFGDDAISFPVEPREESGDGWRTEFGVRGGRGEFWLLSLTVSCCSIVGDTFSLL